MKKIFYILTVIIFLLIVGFIYIYFEAKSSTQQRMQMLLKKQQVRARFSHIEFYPKDILFYFYTEKHLVIGPWSLYRWDLLPIIK
ncbi:hypothetical protein [Candidatus Uabimicrobium sp. HlEnr_7]|uniref:hypothetical protein n=1 Tax=Candidatus Uabimicrobium helgolandensis TaxID=3095367 RepID=UPI003558A429